MLPRIHSVHLPTSLQPKWYIWSLRARARTLRFIMYDKPPMPAGDLGRLSRLLRIAIRRATVILAAYILPYRKFGKQIQKRQLEVPEYAASFVNYKALKKVRRQLPTAWWWRKRYQRLMPRPTSWRMLCAGAWMLLPRVCTTATEQTADLLDSSLKSSRRLPH